MLSRRCSVRDEFFERVGVASATAGGRRAVGRFGSVGAWPRARREVGAGERLRGAKVGWRHSRRQATWGFGALRAGDAERKVALESTGTARAGDGSLWLSYPRRTGYSGLRYTIWESEDLTAWAPVPSDAIEEVIQPVSGQPIEMVWNRILEVEHSAFYRVEISPLNP